MALENSYGNPQEQVVASAALSGSSGRVIALPVSAPWVVMAGFAFSYVATATAGTRQPAVDFKDAAGNLLFRWFQSGEAIVASSTARLQGGAGLASLGGAVFNQGPIPVPLALPPGATITVLDTANIDVNDTVSGTFVYTQ